MFCPDCGTWNRSTARTCGQCGMVLPDVAAPVDAPDHLITSLRQATGHRYRIVRRIGSGGMADVYEARHHQLARPLAVKVLHSHLARESEMRVRFRREAEAASRLVHPFICAPLDYGETDDAVYIVLPYLGGGCLADDLAATRTVEPGRAARISAQVATALDYATRQGIIHRDVKPDNVLFDDDGNAYITDFGIATAHFHGRLTAGGRAMGTPHYMAPEQAMGRFVDGRADLYAVGVMLYECLVGTTPFDGADGYAIGYKHVHELPTPIDRVAPKVPAGLAAIAMKCLEKEPDLRYQRGFELADAIHAWMDADGVVDSPPVRAGAHGGVSSSGTPERGRLVEIALPLPLLRTFTYAAPESPRHPLVAGSRAVVPVKNQRMIGFCVGAGDAAKLGPIAVKNVLDVPDAEPSIGPDLLATCRWISDYYVVPLGLVCKAVLPTALGVASRPAPEGKTERLLVLTGALPTLESRDKAFKRAPQQRQLFELLEQLGGRGSPTKLLAQLGASASVADGLVKRGLAVFEREGRHRDPFVSRAIAPAVSVTPTKAQQAAIDRILGGGTGEAFLLHGITGSGKTLVYLRVLEQVVRVEKKSAIVLVPEISLTPQAVDRFRAVFGDLVAVLHSGLSDGERLDAWRALKRGEKRIAVGARSAVFAPLDDLGAIIVDEEHEGSYKQGETPRYHARDVALVRARAAGARCVLGSATPSLESWKNASEGRLTLLTLPERVGGGRLPEVRVLDLRQELKVASPEERARRQVISASLEALLRERLTRGEQSILLLNRRGYASFVQCEEGHVAVCPNCSISLTYHRTPERLVCHYCAHQEAASRACADCGKAMSRQRGLGTQQVERLLQERLPEARIARMDVDTTSGKWAHTAILDRVASGEVDILLGTQMIAKGLDFANVTLVGVIDADVGMNLPDFRASERTFQLLSQVAGRAGRGPKGGEVVIQTRVPTHHAVRFAAAHDYAGFVAEELSGRSDPPVSPLPSASRTWS